MPTQGLNTSALWQIALDSSKLTWSLSNSHHKMPFCCEECGKTFRSKQTSESQTDSHWNKVMQTLAVWNMFLKVFWHIQAMCFMSAERITLVFTVIWFLFGVQSLSDALRSIIGVCKWLEWFTTKNPPERLLWWSLHWIEEKQFAISSTLNHNGTSDLGGCSLWIDSTEY